MTNWRRHESGGPRELALRLGSQVALAVLVLLCCVGCDSEPPMTSTPLPEPPWTPTATPRGGFRAMPASTATAVPTAVASSELALLGYVLETGTQMEIMGDASRTIVDLLGSPLLGDAAWTALIAAQVVRLREADAVLREIVPPEEYREAHEMLLSASGDSLVSAEYTLKGLQQLDLELLEQGVEYMASAAAKMKLFSQMVEAMTP